MFSFSYLYFSRANNAFCCTARVENILEQKIEVHDVSFVVADRLEDTYPQLIQSWFGSPVGLHIDAWMAVDGVEGWKLELSALAPPIPNLCACTSSIWGL